MIDNTWERPNAAPYQLKMISVVLLLDNQTWNKRYENGFVLYPDPSTGKVDVTLSPKVEGYIFRPMDFTPLHFPSQ